MSKTTRRCAVCVIARSTHSAFTRPNPSTLPSWVSTSVSNRLMVLVLAAGLSGPPRRPTICTHRRIVGQPFSVVGILVARQTTVHRLPEKAHLSRCTLRPPRLSCRHSFAVSVSPSASSNSRQANSPASEVMVAPWNSNRIRRSKRSSRELVFHPSGCLQSAYARTMVDPHQYPSTHDKHHALLFGYIW